MNPTHLSNVSLRRWPYPYRTAFSICSDIDACTWNDFLTIHEFLNTGNETAWGRGLNLEIGDSFWFFDQPHTPDTAFSVFQADHKTPSKYSEPIRALIRAGWLDVLHSYGNFSYHGGFRRELAERAVEWLSHSGLTIKTWVNHGDDWNRQKLGRRAGGGDLPADPAYHADLIRRAGVRFVWESESFVTPVAGQSRPVGFTEAWWGAAGLLTTGERIKSVGKILNGYLKRFAWSPVLNEQVPPHRNDLLQRVSYADGAEFYRFLRYGHGRWDWMEDIPRFINPNVLDDLVISGGVSILYTHLGDRRNRSEPALSGPTINALRLLAEYARQRQTVWVATTTRLLEYQAVLESLAWKVYREGKQIVIEISGVNNPILATGLGIDWLAGITFYTANPEKTLLRYKGREVQTTINPPDLTGRGSISIPRRPLPPFPVEDLKKI